MSDDTLEDIVAAARAPELRRELERLVSTVEHTLDSEPIPAAAATRLRKAIDEAARALAADDLARYRPSTRDIRRGQDAPVRLDEEMAKGRIKL